MSILNFAENFRDYFENYNEIFTEGTQVSTAGVKKAILLNFPFLKRSNLITNPMKIFPNKSSFEFSF